MSVHETLRPEGWKPARGYADGIVASGRTVFAGGMIGWNAEQEFESDDFVDQVGQALANVVALLGAAGAGPEHLTRLTWYVTDIDEYRNRLSEVGVVYRAQLGKVFPAMALVQVVALVEPRAKVEIEATAVIP